MFVARLCRIIPAASRCATSSFSSATVNAPEKTGLPKYRSKLLYQSLKRGILECDIIIGNFAKENLEKMSEKELNSYDKIINGEHMEWDLYYYVSNKKPAPPELEQCQVFQQIKEFVRNSNGLVRH